MRRSLAYVLPLLVSMLACPFAHGQQYPARTVRIVVPYSAGGPVDVLTRGLARRLSELWGQAVIVDNKPGANEIIAAQSVAAAPPDGYTLLMASDATLSLNQFLYAKLPYDPLTAFTPVTGVAVSNLTFFVPAALPVNTLREFVELAKKQPKKLAYGTSGIGTSTHLAMVWFEARTGITLIHVSYKGLAPVIQDMLAGQLQAAFGAASAVASQVKAGKLKALAISGSRRAKLLPDTPTFTEAGFENIDATLVIGLLGPHGMPPDLVAKIAHDVGDAVREPAFREKYLDSVAFDLFVDTPERFAAYLAKDRAKQEQRVKLSGVKLEQ
ncbi:MAG TPA: tripartite tricarboxylate transporter substrate binding protein [Casimicrobiaceae bacterium]|nr:tripartite tricarboxylate transporter substrate binding protein [Casimicrobiaceae bacterium]